jgi:hypothetical protein
MKNASPDLVNTALSEVSRIQEISTDTAALAPPPTPVLPKCRYFIMKSLTEEALTRSVTEGLWSTQQHNESKLNEAFEVIFS